MATTNQSGLAGTTSYPGTVYTAPDRTGVIGAESAVSGVSWGAIVAGAVAAAAITMILMLLGAGLGLTIVSPWSNEGVGATGFAISAVIFFFLVQWIASGIGGYIAGRLRTKWVGLHTDTTFFRDTAHGFLAWALASLIVACMATSALSTAISGGVKATTAVAAAGAAGAGAVAANEAAKAGPSLMGGGVMDPTGYMIDRLFRQPAGAAGAASSTTGTGTTTGTTSGTTTGTTSGTTTGTTDMTGSMSGGTMGMGMAPEAPKADQAAVQSEVTRILVSGVAAGEVPAEDKTYVAQLISERTGISQADAEKRVDEALAQVEAAKVKAKEAADAARKAGITLSLLTFAALLVGAFIASVSAAFGGDLRDKEVLHTI